jgi:DNA repair exonuclease SbcCD ATPase subunit
MKPIQLTWSGLQSYREKQEIDFTLLCDAGVFGIFGPTGSGKSTILDAITLALYGKVERASNGTQGILNQAENVLAVSFTFELSHADGAKRYRVERQFKRGADVSVLNSMCRLIQVQTEQDSVVLADKAGEVNAQVLEILGLSMQDFSRAVILPQVCRIPIAQRHRPQANAAAFISSRALWGCFKRAGKSTNEGNRYRYQADFSRAAGSRGCFRTGVDHPKTAVG